ncbi:MAG: TetR family transcriptional regulator [Solirubrobacteraceae bacterium]
MKTSSLTTRRTTAKSTREQARPRGAARRDALLEAVLRIVADVGAEAVTHRRVAEEAGLPLASTTYWFESKEQLLTAAIELAAARDSARLLDYAAACADEGRDPLDAAIGALLDAPGEDSRSSLMATYALLLEAARRPALRDVARRWTEAYLLALGQLLERAGSGQPRQDAELLLAAADGLLIEQLSTGATTDLRPRLRRLAAALVVSA